ncbi:DUF5320 domain-containing protein [Candidatus Woesearchaeota archaeon]|nr:DUF5320 domain-containing protein [Candidatus Woesearchaeota archaeon]
MPGFDKTGPMGKGAKTGRGFGPCAGNTEGRGFGRKFSQENLSKDEQINILEERLKELKK